MIFHMEPSNDRGFKCKKKCLGKESFEGEGTQLLKGSLGIDIERYVVYRQTERQIERREGLRNSLL